MITKKDMCELIALALMLASSATAQIKTDWNNYLPGNRSSVTIERYTYENPIFPRLVESITVTGKGDTTALPLTGYAAPPLLPNYGIVPRWLAPSFFKPLSEKELHEFQRLVLGNNYEELLR